MSVTAIHITVTNSQYVQIQLVLINALAGTDSREME